MEFLKIVIMGVIGACLYGIVQDQVTVRVCIEYFTIGHPPVFNTTSPTMLALGWGVIATWWVGLPLGLLIAVSARLIRESQLTWRDILKPLGVALLAMAVLSFIAGVIGYFSANANIIVLHEPLSHFIPPDRHAVFMADYWAHTAAYATGFLSGIGLCIWCIVVRLRRGAQL
ncbi:MAG: hypothetical protein EHM48_08850 [Planctomycetaceae bacterium]|nr:MAG: hypothetical protein EHM48_08850 [Planctomycetaceae bacterium]